MYKNSIECYERKEKSTEIYSKYTGPNQTKTQFDSTKFPYEIPTTIRENYKFSQKHNCSQKTTPINITQTSKSFVNTTDPKIWGPAFWFSLHNGAARYPKQASPYVAERMKGFILGIPFMLPCEKCKNHATNHIEKNKDTLDIICSGRKPLFEFFVDFHNYVNIRYDKPIFTNEQAWKLYTGRGSVTYINYA